MGTSTIKLCGVDLSCSSPKQSHVVGGKVHARVNVDIKQFWVFNSYGYKGASDPSFLVYLRDLEEYIIHSL